MESQKAHLRQCDKGQLWQIQGHMEAEDKHSLQGGVGDDQKKRSDAVTLAESGSMS